MDCSVAGAVGADIVGVARSVNLINVKGISGLDDRRAAASTSHYIDAMHDIAKSHNYHCKKYSVEDPDFRGSIVVA